MDNKNAMNKARIQLVDMYVRSLDEKASKWDKPWITIKKPKNSISNKNYKGINQLILSLKMEEMGYDDYRWCTYLQAKNKGWSIKKGEKGTAIEYWSLYDKKQHKTISKQEYDELINSEPEYKDNISFISRISTVFNATQIEGIPELSITQNNIKKPDVLEKFIENIKENMSINIEYGGDIACYIPSKDIIKMPSAEQFKNMNCYYSTLLHENAHATGHSNRLNRNIENTFGTKEYAIEELRAEIAASMLVSELPLEYDQYQISENKAYVQNWSEMIKKDSKVLMDAIHDANNITNYLLEKGKIEEIKKELEIDNEIDNEIEYNNYLSKKR